LPDPLHVGIAECVGVEYVVSVVDTGESTRLGTGVGVEYGVSAVAVVDGTVLRLGVVPNPLRTPWFHPAERVCAVVYR
jgi:hypothetical protein